MASDEDGRPGARGLADVAERYAAGQATSAELHTAFLRATVYCEAGDKPGFVALGSPGTGLVPVFTSEQELVRARGPVGWFATTGTDLFGLLPEGYDIILDLAGPNPLRLRATAVRPMTVADVSWR